MTAHIEQIMAQKYCIKNAYKQPSLRENQAVIIQDQKRKDAVFRGDQTSFKNFGFTKMYCSYGCTSIFCLQIIEQI